MKMGDLKYEAGDDGCDLCAAHEAAGDQIPDGTALTCPHCGHETNPGLLGSESSILPVGETNGAVDDDQEIAKRYVYACRECGNHSQVELRPITWNANHDVYYTGGRKYLPLEPERARLAGELKAAILPRIEEYTRRIQAGEAGLEPWNLMAWAGHEVEHVVAAALARLTGR